MSVQWPVFVTLVLASYISPGPDTVMILRSSVAGRAIGMSAVLGALCGLSIHLVIGAVGLSALIVAFPGSLKIISAIGALYLAYLGIRALKEGRRIQQSRNVVSAAPTFQLQNSVRIVAFRKTFLTNILNPKVILFFVAILPQFVDRASPLPVGVQLGILGFIDVLIGAVYLPILVAFGARAFRSLGSRGTAILESAVGTALIIFAVVLTTESARM